MKHVPTAVLAVILTACQTAPEPGLIEVSGNTLRFGSRSWPCAVGRNGIIAKDDKREGDGCTPAGEYAIRELFFRPDKLPPPVTAIPLVRLKPTDGWCDDPTHSDYNRKINLPFPASHEVMWRKDDLYDLVAVIGYNDDPPISSRGSAIFLHIATPRYKGTAGCIALAKNHLLELLPLLPENARIRIR